MDNSARICIFCRRSIRLAALKASPVPKPRGQWSRSIVTSSSTLATSPIRLASRFAPHLSPWQAIQRAKILPITPLSRHCQFSTSRQRCAEFLDPCEDEDDNEMVEEITARPAAILNPRRGDDGNEMVVTITPRAADRLKQIMTTDSNPDLALRITVESGGCHGFQYLMSLTNMSTVSRKDDTVFEGRDGARIVLDEPSLELLKGSKVDYTMELIGSQFRIVDNPLATSSCGCGTSFDIKA